MRLSVRGCSRRGPGSPSCRSQSGVLPVTPEGQAEIKDVVLLKHMRMQCCDACHRSQLFRESRSEEVVDVAQSIGDGDVDRVQSCPCEETGDHMRSHWQRSHEISRSEAECRHCKCSGSYVPSRGRIEKLRILWDTRKYRRSIFSCKLLRGSLH